MKNAVVSIDGSLLGKWQGGAIGTVHSVYSTAIYLQDKQGKLSCLATSNAANGPEIARIDIEAFEKIAAIVRSGDSFSARQDFVQVGQVEFGYSTCAVWTAKLPQFPPAANLAEQLSIAKSILINYGQPGGLKFVFQPPDSQEPIAAALCQRAERLLLALKQRQLANVETYGQSLIGLGNGLTPSGDDFLAALITVFNLSQDPFPEQYREFGRSWAAVAQSVTTSVGAFLLNIAAHGRAREPVRRFLADLSIGSCASIAENAKDVLRFGSSSGTDWLAGLTAGLEAGLALQKRIER